MSNVAIVATVVWHFWMGVAVAGLAITAAIGIVAGYFLKVVKPRYPGKGQVRVQ